MSDFPDPFQPRSTPIVPSGPAFAPPPQLPPPPPPPPPPFGGTAVPPGYVPYSQALPTFRYAGWWSRVGAFLLDGAVLVACYMPGFLYLGSGPSAETACVTDDGGLVRCTEPTGATMAIGMILILAGIVGFLVLYCTMASRAGSIGHRAVGIRIVDARTGDRVGAWRIFGRRVASYLSSLPCYLGFLWPLWDQRKQTWHDMIAKTVVVRTR